MPSAILFDFFGTLVTYQADRLSLTYSRSFELLQGRGFEGSYEEFNVVWDRCFEARCQKSQEDLREFTMEEVASDLFAQLCPDAQADLSRFIEVYLKEWSDGVQYISGLPKFLSKLSSQYRIGLVSNTHHAPLVEGHLEKMGVRRLFEVVVTSDRFGYRKPHREIFHKALQELRVPPSDAVYIGDSFNDDYQGAREAGMRCLLIDPDGRAECASADRLTSVFDIESKITSSGYSEQLQFS